MVRFYKKTFLRYSLPVFCKILYIRVCFRNNALKLGFFNVSEYKVSIAKNRLKVFDLTHYQTYLLYAGNMIKYFYFVE